MTSQRCSFLTTTNAHHYASGDFEYFIVDMALQYLLTTGRNFFSSLYTDTSSPRSNNNMEPWTPSYADICIARAMLKSRGLPTELVLDILEYAQYVPEVEFTTTQRTVASAPSSSAVVCLVAGVLADDITHKLGSPKAKLKTTEIEFHIDSHDQGWTSEQTQGTFDTSSWLEVSIVRGENRMPNNHQESLSNAYTNNYNNPVTMHHHLRTKGQKLVARPAEASIGPQGGEEPLAWYLQGNRVTERENTKYRVLWGRDHHEANEDNEGAGTGVKFVEGLQEGDSVVVWARAKYPGWRCEVNSIKMVVRYGFAELT